MIETAVVAVAQGLALRVSVASRDLHRVCLVARRTDQLEAVHIDDHIVEHHGLLDQIVRRRLQHLCDPVGPFPAALSLTVVLSLDGPVLSVLVPGVPCAPRV